MAGKSTRGPVRAPTFVWNGVGPLVLGAGLAPLECPPPLEAAATHFRSIGTVADYGTLEPVLGNGTQVSVTLGSDAVSGVGGTTWRAANRSSSSLVADDRVEVGIAYTDSPFVPPNGFTIPKDAPSITTDATHDITLTADPGNRHRGAPGTGVLIHNPGCVSQSLTMVHFKANHVTFEWFEVRDSDADGVKLEP